MALPNKPSIKNVWATSGLKVEPSDTKVNTGWIVERPPHQFQNFLQNRSDQFLKHINEAGIPVWDAVTVYTAGKSYVQGSDGLLYKAKTTGANQDPVGNPTNWMLTLGETDFQDVIEQTEDNALAAANSASEAAVSEANALATVPVFDDVAPTPNLAGKQWTSAVTGKRYEWIVDADSGQWVEMGPQTTFGATAFGETLAADDGATKVGTPNGTVQEELDGRLKILSDGTQYLPSGTESWSPRILSSGQGVFGDGATKTNRSIGGGLTAITMANMSAVGRLQFNGEGKTSGTPGTVGVYSEAWGGNIDQLTVQNLNGTAVRAKGGWNLNITNLRVTQAKTGLEFIEYAEVLPGWAGSGHVIGPAFITFCDVGIDLGKLWNPTLINVVLEYCDVPAKFSGTHQVIINPWFEGNTNTPLWTRGAVLLGGRGVTFQSTLDADLPGTSAGAAQEEAITWLDEQGISVFRNPSQRMFYATGRKGVQALRHFGVEGLTELAVQGRHLMPTATQADFSSLRGYGARESTFITPTDQFSTNHETSAIVNRGNRSGDVISGSVVIRTGTKGATPGDGTSVDRWQFNSAGHVLPMTTSVYDIGSTTLRMRSVYSDSFRLGTGTQGVFSGTATPEGAIVANPGSIYLRNDGTGGNPLYLKSTGTGNTGWIRMQGLRTGTTAQRPSDADTGTMYFDTTLGKPVWKLGANWVDATGTTV